MMLAVCSGMDRTVAAASRSAYIFRSAGAISDEGAMMATPQAHRVSLNSAMERPTVKPGIASSLSSVPPV